MATYKRADKPNLRTGLVPAPKKTPRSYESYPEGATHNPGAGPKDKASSGSRGHVGVGAKNQDMKAKM